MGAFIKIYPVDGKTRHHVNGLLTDLTLGFTPNVRINTLSEATKRMAPLSFLLSLILFTSIRADGQDNERIIEFPDVPGFLTLKCDLHIHTVFSDGKVWPNIRIDEAVKDGLDAISLTEHLEYQPHSDDIPHPDRNRSYNLAKKYAKPHDLIIIHGVEITKDLPPSHANAIFITDANLLNHEDPMTAYRAAAKQGAFVFWNHPNWIQQQGNALPVITPLHRQLIDNNLLHGIEVVNDLTYSEQALELAKANGLTTMGTSDIHGLIDWQYGLAEGGHRPISLVFATDRTEAGIKSALKAGRSVAWFNNVLIGKEAHVSPLIESCLSFKSRDFIGPSSVEEIIISNNSDAQFLLKNKSTFDFYNQSDIIIVEPHGETLIQILTKTGTALKHIEMEVLSTVIGRQEHPVIEFEIERGWLA